MYKEAAGFYDRLTSDVNYEKYAEFFSAIFDKHIKKHPHSIVDLGCGTGNLTIAMAEKGYDMTGVDSSSEMLSSAYSKKSPGILWINQNFTELDLFGTYDAAVSLLDCINHMLDDDSVRKYFRHMRNFIEHDGLFVFDINSEYKFNHVYKDNVFYSVDEDLSYIWQNDYNSATGICTMDITFYKKDGDIYERFDTVNKEKSYSISHLSELLGESGFAIEALYSDCVMEEPTDSEKRIFLVCRRGN